MRTLMIAAAVTLSSALMTPASAQNEAAYLSTERLLAESPQGRQAVQEIEALNDRLQKEIEALYAEIATLRQRIIDGASTLDPVQLAQLREELGRKEADLQIRFEDATREAAKLRDRLLQALEPIIQAAIEEERRSRNIGLVFNRDASAIAAADPGLDITDDVLIRLRR